MMGWRILTSWMLGVTLAVAGCGPVEDEARDSTGTVRSALMTNMAVKCGGTGICPPQMFCCGNLCCGGTAVKCCKAPYGGTYCSDDDWCPWGPWNPLEANSSSSALTTVQR